MDKAKTRYMKKAYKAFSIQLHKENDADIIQKLDSVPNKQGYVKGLIRDDISKEKKASEDFKQYDF